MLLDFKLKEQFHLASGPNHRSCLNDTIQTNLKMINN